MALLRFISLSVGSLMLLQGAYVNGNPTGTDATAKCLTAMNAARTAAGLNGFTAAQAGDQQLLKDNVTAMNKVCTTLKENQTVALPIMTTVSEGTGIYFVQQAEDCSAAVDKWKTGFSGFKSYTSEAPPAFKATNAGTDQIGAEAPYNTVAAVDFVALYSPKATTADCSFVDCAEATDKSTLKTLVCVVHPPALENNQPPYSLEQWKKILAVLAPSSSSASAAVPTLLALAAAAVGVALM